MGRGPYGRRVVERGNAVVFSTRGERWRLYSALDEWMLMIRCCGASERERRKRGCN